MLFPAGLFAQNTIGLPDVINYSKQSYNGGLQNWDIAQDNNGLIYFANNEGLLSFDGKYWNNYALPNKTIVRSIHINKSNRIYVGGQDELGYFSSAPSGQLEYHSLVDLIPAAHRVFGDVWDIESVGNDVYFRTIKFIFKLSNGTMAVYFPTSQWDFLGISNGSIYAQDLKTGLRVFENNAWRILPGFSELPADDPVTAILSINSDSSLITTLKSGLFMLSRQGIKAQRSDNNELFKNERIYAATVINKDWIALATSNNGIYITDVKGTIIQSFSAAEGLQNKNVLSIYLDNQRNIWLGLDNGIDFIAYNSAIKQINPMAQGGSGYTALIYQNRLYTGTTNGLYSAPLQKTDDYSFSRGSFSAVNNTQGQVWSIAEINNHLLLGKHEGAFEIVDNTARSLTGSTGFWNFLPVSNTFPSATIIAGTYTGAVVFDFINDRFVPNTSISKFNESSRFLAIDELENIWISHPYHGIYKITKDASGLYQTKIYTDNKGLPSALNNHIFKINNQVLAATEKGVYSYNAPADVFEPDVYYSNLLGQQSVRYLKNDASGNLWFIHEKIIGVIDFSAKEPTIIYLPELNNKMLSGFEFIYPVNDSNIFIGGEKGFYHVNYKKYKNNIPDLKVHLRSVRAFSATDSLLYGGYFSNVNEPQVQPKNKVPSLEHDWKTIRFEFSTALYGYQANLEYSYRLKGYEEEWSDWTKRTEKEYTNLAQGNYFFEVKVRNNLGVESPVTVYKFEMLAPWYLSGLAVAIYLLLIAIVLWLFYRWLKQKFRLQRQKYEEEQKRLLYIHELERANAESELVTLRNEKLESDIAFKNAELASSAMHLVKKGELLTKIKADLTHVTKELQNPQATTVLKKMIKNVGEDDNMDKEWENFAKHFDTVHSDFLVTLKEKHPDLSGNELKLCANLRMNLSTKEIAQLMNISVRGVEISRYRLRKKLKLATETNLFDYLINI